MYQIIFLPDAEDSFKKLDKTIQQRIAGKIDWLAENADTMIHHHLSSLPEDLRGLCIIRIGDYRVFNQNNIFIKFCVHDESSIQNGGKDNIYLLNEFNTLNLYNKICFTKEDCSYKGINR